MDEVVVRRSVQLTDTVSPTLVEHRVEAAKDPETSEWLYYYNYIYYEFAVSAGRISALSYLPTGEQVHVTAPVGMRIDAADVENVLAYLKLRFVNIGVHDEAGNELLIWAEKRSDEAGQ